MWTWCPFLQSFNKLGKSTEWSNSSSFSFFPSPGPFPPAWQRSPSLKVHIEPHGSFRQVYHQEQHTDANNTLDRQHEVMRRKNMLLIARFGMLELYWPCRSIHINVNSCVCVCILAQGWLGYTHAVGWRLWKVFLFSRLSIQQCGLTCTNSAKGQQNEKTMAQGVKQFEV